MFLADLAERGNVREACRAARIDRPVAYNWRDADATFRLQWENAMEQACDKLVEAARKRAMTVSDTLMIFLLKSHRPSVYRETYRHEHTGAGGGPLSAELLIPGGVAAFRRPKALGEGDGET